MVIPSKRDSSEGSVLQILNVGGELVVVDMQCIRKLQELTEAERQICLERRLPSGWNAIAVADPSKILMTKARNITNSRQAQAENGSPKPFKM